MVSANCNKICHCINILMHLRLSFLKDRFNFLKMCARKTVFTNN